jgi:hypothetical protein
MILSADTLKCKESPWMPVDTEKQIKHGDLSDPLSWYTVVLMASIKPMQWMQLLNFIDLQKKVRRSARTLRLQHRKDVPGTAFDLRIHVM